MQKQKTPTTQNEFTLTLGAVAVSLATLAAVFTQHAPPNRQPIVAVQDVHKIFEHEKKVLHPQEKYIVRNRYETSIGAGAA